MHIMIFRETAACAESLPPGINSTPLYEAPDNELYFVDLLDAQKQDLQDLEFLPKRQAIQNADQALRPALVRAFQLANWYRRFELCTQCGASLTHTKQIHELHCLACNIHFYPTHSPVAIVLINRGDKALLARSPNFPKNTYGLIAGYVEPGESLEECLHREVFEEVGLTIKNLKYYGSQSWPSPSSLMIGFTADYDGGEINLQDDEMQAADWSEKNALPI